MTTKQQEAPTYVGSDPGRTLTCGHKNAAVARPVLNDNGEHDGWWQVYAKDCILCNGDAGGLPFKPPH